MNSHSEHESESDLVRTRRRIETIENVERRRAAALATLRRFHHANRQEVQLVARRVAIAVIEGFKRKRRLAGPPEMEIVRRVVKLARKCLPRRACKSVPGEAGDEDKLAVSGPSPSATELAALAEFEIWCRRLNGQSFLTMTEVVELWVLARSGSARAVEPGYDVSWATRAYFADFVFGDALHELGAGTRRSRLVAFSLFLRAALSSESKDDWIRAWLIHYDSELLTGVRRAEDSPITGVNLREYFSKLQGAPSGTWVGRGHGWPPASSRTMDKLIVRGSSTPVDLHLLELLEPVAHLLELAPSGPSDACSTEIDIPSALALMKGQAREWPRADLRRNGTDELTVAFLVALGSAGGAQVPATALEAPLDRKERTIYEVAGFLQAVDGGALIERRNRGYVLTDRGAWEYRALVRQGRGKLRAN